MAHGSIAVLVLSTLGRFRLAGERRQHSVKNSTKSQGFYRMFYFFPRSFEVGGGEGKLILYYKSTTEHTKRSREE